MSALQMALSQALSGSKAEGVLHGLLVANIQVETTDYSYFIRVPMRNAMANIAAPKSMIPKYAQAAPVIPQLATAQLEAK